MNDIVIKGLRKSFEGKPVLKDLSLTFPAGKVTCVAGPSGCGKTTLLRVLAGLETPDAGTVENVPERIAYVFQEDRLAQDFSALSNLRLVLGHRDTRAEEKLLMELGLDPHDKSPVRTLSGGMRRRVALARALAYRGDLVLLDEPFKGLDAALRESVIRVVLEQTAGKTVICVTHDPREAELLQAELITLTSAERIETTG